MHYDLDKACRKKKFLWPCPGSEMRSRSQWKVSCTSIMIVQLIGTKYVQICEAVWAESPTSTTRLIYKVCRITKFFVTLSWIWNKVNVKLKGMLHIYNYCTIDWHQVCANTWNGLGWVAHTKYHPYSGRTHRRTHRWTWILCPPFGHSPCGGQSYWLDKRPQPENIIDWDDM